MTFAPTAASPLIDTHAHLDYLVRGQMPDAPGQDPVEVLARAKAEGVISLINPSVSPDRFDEVIALAERFENVYAAVAVHPTDVQDFPDEQHWLTEMERLLSHPKVVAVGETGLDYYHSTEHVETQHRCFLAHLRLAARHRKPVIIHDREAHEAVARLVAQVQGEFPPGHLFGVMHCFSGDAAFAQRMIALGFYISFAGNITFKNAHGLREAAKAVPLEWLLVETDSPFLSPMPFRGQTNEPARVRLVAETLAGVKGLTLEEIAAATTENAQRLFGLKDTPYPAFGPPLPQGERGVIRPGAWLGVLGGGQLGRMFAMSAHRLGYRVMVLTPEQDSPASQVADETLVAAYDDPKALQQLAQRCDAITLEFENLPVKALESLETLRPVRPGSRILELAQHRLREKTGLSTLGLPVTPFVAIDSEQDLDKAWTQISQHSSAAVLKTAGFGYDGKGQQKVDSLEALKTAYLGMPPHAKPPPLGGWEDKVQCILEAWIPFEREISVVAARNPQGQFVCTGPIENRHHNHILDVSLWPGRVSERTAQEAIKIARKIMIDFKVVGLLCVEFFVTRDQNGEERLLINEIAPRPHNSGHLTIEGMGQSQFDWQVRALCGLPLGEAIPNRPGQWVAMANLLGDHLGEAPDWESLLASFPEINLHLYGKRESRLGRKMGHLTGFGSNPEAAMEQVIAARAFLTLRV